MAKMENIRLFKEGDDLVIRVNTKIDDTIASSGNSVLIACTHNWKPLFVDGEELDLQMNLNIKRDFEPDEPRTVEDGWIRRQDRK